MRNILKPFDLDGDGFIDISDLALIANAFGKRRGEPGYKERFDFDGDGEIGQMEINVIAAMFGVRIRDDDDDD